ncbi:MAG: PilN domain-containing protein [Cetobacterium sp.]|uniref:PilN domain-containing protein n=1 Tax=Cetobacterium sp. TaxID=2071632 RepID=UPI002FC92AF5
MKIEILSNEIVLYKKEEMVSKLLFNHKNQIFLKVYELISDIEELKEIKIFFDEILLEDEGDILTYKGVSISSEIFYAIIDLVKEKNGKIGCFSFIEKNLDFNNAFGYEKKIIKIKYSIILSLVSIFILISGSIYLENNLKKIDKKIQNIDISEKILREEIGVLRKSIEEFELENIEYNKMKEELNTKTKFNILFNRIRNIVPSEVYLKSIDIENKKIKLYGNSKFIELVYEFEKKLDNLEVISKVNSDFIKNTGGDFEYLIELEVF